MTTFRIRRSGDVDLTFDGELLADLSSRRGDQQAWTEIRIYRTDSDRFVTEMIGRSLRVGQYDLIKVAVCDTPEQVREGLRREQDDNRIYLTRLAVEALTAASEKDQRLAAALEERI